MATKTTRIDDLDGTTEDVRAVTLTIDGTTWEIDLGPASRERLESAVAEFTEAGRRVKTPAGRRSAGKTPGSGVHGNAVRAWARENGHEVGDRGRIPAAILEAYRAATA